MNLGPNSAEVPPTDPLWYRAVYNGAVARAHAYEALGDAGDAVRRKSLLTDATRWARELTLALMTPCAPGRDGSLDDGFRPGVRAIRVAFREPAVLLLAGLTCMVERADSVGKKREDHFQFGSGSPDWQRAREIVRSSEAADPLKHGQLVQTLGDPANLTPRGHYNLAAYLALGGYHEDALSELTAATRELGAVTQARTDPSLRALRNYPRFQALTQPPVETPAPDAPVAALLQMSTQLEALAVDSKSKRVAGELLSTARAVTSLARDMRQGPQRRSKK